MNKYATNSNADFGPPSTDQGGYSGPFLIRSPASDPTPERKAQIAAIRDQLGVGHVPEGSLDMAPCKRSSKPVDGNTGMYSGATGRSPVLALIQRFARDFAHGTPPAGWAWVLITIDR